MRFRNTLSGTGESYQPARNDSGVGQLGQLHAARDGQTRLLVDAGLGKKETLRRLDRAEPRRSISTASSSPTNTPITSVAARRCWASGAPRFIFNAATAAAEVMRILPETSHKRLDRVEHIRAGHRFCVGDIEVSPFSIPHDAVDPLGFTFRANATKVAIVTDLGYLPELVKDHLRGFRLPDAGIQSRSGNAEGGAVSVAHQAAGDEPHGTSLESHGERISVPTRKRSTRTRAMLSSRIFPRINNNRRRRKNLRGRSFDAPPRGRAIPRRVACRLAASSHGPLRPLERCRATHYGLQSDCLKFIRNAMQPADPRAWRAAPECSTPAEPRRRAAP